MLSQQTKTELEKLPEEIIDFPPNRFIHDLDLGAIILVVTPTNNFDGLKVALTQFRGKKGELQEGTEKWNMVNMMQLLGRGLAALVLEDTELVHQAGVVTIGDPDYEADEPKPEVVTKQTDLKDVTPSGNA